MEFGGSILWLVPLGVFTLLFPWREIRRIQRRYQREMRDLRVRHAHERAALTNLEIEVNYLINEDN